MAAVVHNITHSWYNRRSLWWLISLVDPILVLSPWIKFCPSFVSSYSLLLPQSRKKLCASFVVLDLFTFHSQR